MNQKLLAVVRKCKVGFLNQQLSPFLVFVQLQGIVHSVHPFGELGCIPAFLLLPSSSHGPEVLKKRTGRGKCHLMGLEGFLLNMVCFLSNCIVRWWEVSHRTHLTGKERQMYFSCMPKRIGDKDALLSQHDPF